MCLASGSCAFPLAQEPPLEVAFYLLRIEYTTTSDWTSLELHNPEDVLTVRMMDTTVDDVPPHVGINSIAFGQSPESALAGESVAVTVDFAVDASGIHRPLEFTTQKGGLNDSIIRFILIIGNRPQLIREIVHEGTLGTPGLNPLDFQVDLRPFADEPPTAIQIQQSHVPKMILAFYFPWYGMRSWSSSELADWPLVPYASNDPDTMRRHIEQAKGAAIDGFIFHWLGPGSDSDENLARILDIAQEMDFRVAVFFIAWNGDRWLEEEVMEEWLSYLIETYGNHAAYMRANSKPLIVCYNTAALPLLTWESIFEDLRAQGLDSTNIAMGSGMESLSVFDGLYDPSIFDLDGLHQRVTVLGRAVHYHPVLDNAAEAKFWAATVRPGYDDRRIVGSQGTFVDRGDGDFYRGTFDAALVSNPDWIFISSWNKWGEHTYIEPSLAFGDLYLLLTREFAQEWKDQ